MHMSVMQPRHTHGSIVFNLRAVKPNWLSLCDVDGEGREWSRSAIYRETAKKQDMVR